MADEAFIPPHDIEAEQAVLGAIFVDPRCLGEVTLILQHPTMFWRTSHQHIFEAIQQLNAEAREVDWVTVGEQLRKNGVIEECGGQDALHDYLSEISHSVPSAYGAGSYAAIVRDRALMRMIVLTAGDIRSMALDATKTPGEVIERLEQQVFEISARRYHGETHTMQALIQQVMEQQQLMKEWRANHDGLTLPGLSSGYSDLDMYTTGWKAGELIVIGARPGQGKTSLLLNLAENMALELPERRNDGKGGMVIFSLEMTGTELVQRILCARARVDLSKVKLGNYGKDEEAELKSAQQQLATTPIFVDDSFTLTMSEIRSKARRMKERHDIEVIFVDYLQLVKDNDRLDRHLQIGNISRGLKALARELQIPVICAAQLNRSVEQRSTRERRPMLSDLRESGSIEQDADQVILLHKREMEDGDHDPGRVDFIDLVIAKNRNGPTGVVEMVFHKSYTRFEMKDRRVPTNWASIPQG